VQSMARRERIRTFSRVVIEFNWQVGSLNGSVSKI
jgi:hypothetical protein